MRRGSLGEQMVRQFDDLASERRAAGGESLTLRRLNNVLFVRGG